MPINPVDCLPQSELGDYSATASTLTFTPSQSSGPPPLATNATTLRSQLLGKWTYLSGDSSGRGLFLSLYQQLLKLPSNASRLHDAQWLGDQSLHAQSASDLAYLDVILTADGTPIAVRSSALLKGPWYSPWSKIPPLDSSHEVAHLWCADSSGTTTRRKHLGGHTPVPCTDRTAPLCTPPPDRIRLTYRGRTLAHYLPDEPFSELRTCTLVATTSHGQAHLSRPPDIHIVQDGSYDDRALTPRCLYERQLLAGLTNWRDAADEASTTRVFATAAVAPRLTIRHTNLPARLPFVLLPPSEAANASAAQFNLSACKRICPLPPSSPRLRSRACVELVGSHVGRREAYHGAAWERELFVGGMECEGAFAAAMARAVQGVRLLNRVSTGLLLKQRRLLSRCACLDEKARETLWSVSMRYHPPHLHNLVDVVRLLELVKRPAAVAGGSAPIKMQLAQPLERCCCTDDHGRVSTTGGRMELKWMWSELCRLA